MTNWHRKKAKTTIPDLKAWNLKQSLSLKNVKALLIFSFLAEVTFSNASRSAKVSEKNLSHNKKRLLWLYTIFY